MVSVVWSVRVEKANCPPFNPLLDHAPARLVKILDFLSTQSCFDDSATMFGRKISFNVCSIKTFFAQIMSSNLFIKEFALASKATPNDIT